MTIQHIDDMVPDAQTAARWRSNPAIIDLALLAGFALLLPLLPQLPSLVRVPVGVFATLFAPGYALVAAVFSRRADFDLIARAALSFGLSIALLPVLALLLNASPWGLQPGPMLVALACTIVMLCGSAAVRRWRMPTESRSHATSPAIARQSLGTSRTMISIVIGAVLVACVLGGATYVVATPYPTPQFTEFYALGREGLSESYTREVAVGEHAQVSVGISNHEGTTMRYQFEVRGGNEQLARTGPITVAAGKTHEQVITYALAHAGDNQPIDILLYANDNPIPYRTLRLWVNVRATP